MNVPMILNIGMDSIERSICMSGSLSMYAKNAVKSKKSRKKKKIPIGKPIEGWVDDNY